jgi:hypothetical protein
LMKRRRNNFVFSFRYNSSTQLARTILQQLAPGCLNVSSRFFSDVKTGLNFANL